MLVYHIYNLIFEYFSRNLYFYVFQSKSVASNMERHLISHFLAVTHIHCVYFLMLSTTFVICF